MCIQNITYDSKIFTVGNSLAVQWLGLGIFTAEGKVQSQVEELRSHKLPGIAKE